MITPLVDESVWLERLRSLPRFMPPQVPTLVVSPHPDDETLGAGGLIAWLRARGNDVQVAAVTDGENAYPGEPGLREARRQEQTLALARLGVEAATVHRFGMVDSGVKGDDQRLIEHLVPLVSPETHIVAPWPNDFHPDHEACGRAAERVAAMTGARLTFYFFWTWHRAEVDLLDGLPLVSFPLDAELQRAKRDALQCHESQLRHPSGQPILPEYLLGPAARPFEVYLPS